MRGPWVCSSGNAFFRCRNKFLGEAQSSSEEPKKKAVHLYGSMPRLRDATVGLGMS